MIPSALVVPSARLRSSILRVGCDGGKGGCGGERFVDGGSRLLRYVPLVRHQPSILHDNLSSS